MMAVVMIPEILEMLRLHQANGTNKYSAQHIRICINQLGGINALKLLKASEIAEYIDTNVLNAGSKCADSGPTPGTVRSRGHYSKFSKAKYFFSSWKQNLGGRAGNGVKQPSPNIKGIYNNNINNSIGNESLTLNDKTMARSRSLDDESCFGLSSSSVGDDSEVDYQFNDFAINNGNFEALAATPIHKRNIIITDKWTEETKDMLWETEEQEAEVKRNNQLFAGGIQRPATKCVSDQIYPHLEIGEENEHLDMLEPEFRRRATRQGTVEEEVLSDEAQRAENALDLNIERLVSDKEERASSPEIARVREFGKEEEEESEEGGCDVRLDPMVSGARTKGAFRAEKSGVVSEKSEGAVSPVGGGQSVNRVEFWEMEGLLSYGDLQDASLEMVTTGSGTI